MPKGWRYLDFLTNKRLVLWHLTNQRRACCVPSADPDKVKTTDLALVNVIASSDSSRPKITESLPGLVDSVRPKLITHRQSDLDIRDCIETMSGKLFWELNDWVREGVRLKNWKEKYCESPIGWQSQHEGEKSERSLSRRGEVQKSQRPRRKF